MTKHLKAFTQAQPDASRGGLAALAHAVVTTPDAAITQQMREDAAQTAAKVDAERADLCRSYLPFVVKAGNGNIVAMCCGSAWAAAAVVLCTMKGATVEYQGRVVYKSSGLVTLNDHDLVWKMISDAIGGVA